MQLIGYKVEIGLSMKLPGQFKLFITPFICLAILALSSCQPKVQKDCGFVQNVYGQRISWKTKSKIELVISKDIPTQLRPAIYRAVATWEKIIGQKIFEITEDSLKASSVPSKDGKSGIYFLSSWESDRQSEQGRTTVYWGSDQIMEADIRINALDFSYYDQEQTDLVVAASRSGTSKAFGSTDGYNFEALILHELGHFLGLKHSSEKGSVMGTHLSAYNNRIEPTLSDNESVKCAYNN